MKVFTLPDLGEGLPDAEIVNWYVAEGETVKIDQPLVAMETAKAVVDLPSPTAGKIIKIFGKPGDIINTGSVLIEFETEREDTGTVAGVLETSDKVIAAHTHIPINSSITANNIKATPAVRALAQKLQVDLNNIKATGPDNTITSKDIEHAAAQTSEPSQGFEQLKGVRRAMAHAMEKSLAQVVPVTLFEDAILINYTPEMDLTVSIILALAKACKAEPALNAWFESKSMARQLIPSLNLGIAMDTEDGLFVPVIRDTASKNAETLRQEINIYKQQVQQRSVKPEDLRSASFVLSNFGTMAGKYATPIIIPPSVAILGVGKIRDAVVPVDGKPAVAKILPLSLSFDHRACTGGEASRFMGILLENLV